MFCDAFCHNITSKIKGSMTTGRNQILVMCCCRFYELLKIFYWAFCGIENKLFN